MASDDRDQTFEKALARHLRPSASSSADANALAGAQDEACPDPEMLAAYHDGLLSSDERNLWKNHVLSCDNCQLVLAHLATSLDIPVPKEAENVVVLQQPVSAARTVSSARIPRPSPLHSLRWLWLVPAGAIAATLIAWVSLRESKPLPLASSSPVEVAENRQPSVAAPSAKTERAGPAEAKEADREKDQPTALSAAGIDSANRDLATKAPQKQIQPTQQSPFQYAPKPSHGPSLSAQKQEQQIGRIAAGSAGGALDLKKLDAQTAPIVNGRAVGSFAQSVPAPPPSPPSLPSSEPSFLADESVSAPLKDKSPAAPVPAPASNVAAAKTKAANADAISAVTETVEVTAAPESPAGARAQEHAREHAMMRDAALQNPHVFWAPGGKQAWRVGPAGFLEHSKDKGLNWIAQISGVYTDLLAGSAPSTKVCWIVGASGTILRTTDGGTHWTKLDSPATNDLTAVRATDAMHAWISFVPDLRTGLIKTYQTSDGGRIWFSVPSE
jgi:hypothetical protein